jgi:two-component sensor histidine kinase
VSAWITTKRSGAAGTKAWSTFHSRFRQCATVGGIVVGASKIARDISLRKQAEATRQLLLGELNHRVKNTLASVQAIAQQTLLTTEDPTDFATRFAGRIQSLASAHSLLVDATWHGADLRMLIGDQLSQ